MSERSPIHAVAWVIWLGTVIVALATTRNPIYLGVILLWLAVTAWIARFSAPAANAPIPISPIYFGLVVVSLSALFNMLNVHVGTTVLFRLPRHWPVIGGAITLEAIVYGALNGLVLTGLFMAFTLVNRVLSMRELVQLIPRAYYPIAVVVSIAVTFVPNTLRQFQQIREAQAIRGHRVRGVRSWLPLIMPLLIGGLERALQLAEAMMARGFTASTDTSSPTRSDYGASVAMILGLPIVAAGLILRTIWGLRATGLGLIWGGALLVMGAVWLAGKRHPHTVYRPAPWQQVDWLVVAGALAMTAIFAGFVPGLDRASLFYYPYPSLILPDFNLWIGLSTWGMLLPALALAQTGIKRMALEKQRGKKRGQAS